MRSLILENSEKLYSMSELRRVIQIKRCARTLTRWCDHGKNGVLLECVNGPSGRMSSVEAYKRFMEAIQ